MDWPANRWSSGSRHVVWIGPHTDPPWSGIVAAARLAGLDLEFAAEDDDLLAILRRSPRSTLVVCKTDGDSRAGETLAQLASAARFNPVLVLVERAEFGDYYDLMQRGATYYFDAFEEPDSIVRAIRRATTGLSADEPPRRSS